MFSVPGWSVSSNVLKTQTSSSSRPQLSQSTTLSKPASEQTGKASKKRKRPRERTTLDQVDSNNFAELWETIIDKKVKKQSDSAKPEVMEKHQQAEKRSDRAVSTLRNNPKSEGGKDQSLEIRRDGSPKGIAQLQQSKNVPSAYSEMTKFREAPSTVAQLTPLQISMRQKLTSARFRHLNQTLYTTPSARSRELFQENPEMFEEYHEGFRRQVEVWPENPVDGYVTEIKQRGVQRHAVRNFTALARSKGEGNDLKVLPLPRTQGICRIADLGCGDARISHNLARLKRKLKIEVLSYDLQTTNPLVTKADIANLPLEDGSIDIAIFCLALMGTNWIDFIEEAFRILRWKGELWIAEIKSRFGRVSNKRRRVEHSIGNKKKVNKEAALRLEDDVNDADLLLEVDGHEDNTGKTDVSEFVEILRKRGFILQAENGIDLSNKMFVKMGFVKGQTPVKGKYVPLPKGMVELGVDTWRSKPRVRFLDNEEKPALTEASVLKPCIYKIR